MDGRHTSCSSGVSSQPGLSRRVASSGKGWYSVCTQVKRLRIHPSVIVFLYGSDENPPPNVEQPYLDVFHDEVSSNVGFLILLFHVHALSAFLSVMAESYRCGCICGSIDHHRVHGRQNERTLCVDIAILLVPDKCWAVSSPFSESLVSICQARGCRFAAAGWRVWILDRRWPWSVTSHV